MEPEKLFGDISAFVNDSRDLLNQGAMTELAGLENRVLLLCKEVMLLSEDERVRYAGRLQQLMTDLTALGEEITAHRDAVAEELRNLPSHKKAYAAYRITEMGDRKEEEK